MLAAKNTLAIAVTRDPIQPHRGVCVPCMCRYKFITVKISYFKGACLKYGYASLDQKDACLCTTA